MPIACPAKPVSRDRCKWNPRVCIRFRVRSKFPRVDRLLKLQAASHAACWRYKFPLPSYLSVRQPKAAGTCGKVGWKRAKTAGDGMGGQPLKRGLCAAACLTGGEPGQKHRTDCWLRISCCRVLGVASTGKYVVWPEADAVKTQVRRTAFTCPNRIARFARSLPCASREPCRVLWRPVSVVGAERPSRLCVLINQSCRARSIGTKPA